MTLAELLGIFYGLDITKTVRKYFSNKFKNDYTTVNTVIKYDDLIHSLSLLEVVPRDTKAPILKQDGFVRKTVEPDVIKGTQVITPEELSKMQAGQVETYIKGEKVNNSDIVYNRKMQALKIAYERTVEAMATDLYLNGKLVFKNSGNEFTIGSDDEISVTEKQFTKKTEEFTTFLIDLITKFEKENTVLPNTIEIGTDLFKYLMSDETFSRTIRTFNHGGINKGDNSEYPTFGLLNYQIKVLPLATGVDGKTIETKNLLILSNDSEFTNVYAGLGVKEGDKVKMIEADVYINEKAEDDPVRQKITLQSAYMPIIPLPKRVKRYKVTFK
ncbi:major capsid protein [Streptobacillus moniliformis]|uniref:major capsid protein n=1 Tax=Streptobacillus moniliformis TaxID=34105 RepID=UPI0007E33FC9|nr:major capsid protein [Streptobacillus moniliformis]